MNLAHTPLSSPLHPNTGYEVPNTAATAFMKFSHLISCGKLWNPWSDADILGFNRKPFQ